MRRHRGTGLCDPLPFDPVDGLLSALDGALTEVDDAKASGLKIAFMGNGDAAFAAPEMEAWRAIFTEAFEKNLFEITTSPVSIWMAAYSTGGQPCFTARASD